MIKVEVATGGEVRKFPKLMAHNDGTVALINSDLDGFVLYAPKGSREIVGEYVAHFNIHVFHDFNGSITLSNGD